MQLKCVQTWSNNQFSCNMFNKINNKAEYFDTRKINKNI